MRISQQSATSDTGRKRRHNEDAFVCEPPLFAVADGMGGARAGELASSLAAGALLEAGLAPADGAERYVVELIQGANRRVHERAVSDSSASGMGTTMTVALFRPGGSVVIGHVGDSRAYVLRDGRLAQLTEDHSLVAELVRRGELSPEQAEVHPQRSVITRALGTEPEVDIDAFTVEARDGDVFLLCSDGLTTMVDPTTIGDVLERNRSELALAGRELIRVANNRGGEDNITTVLFAVADDVAEPLAAAPDQEPEPGRDLADEDTLHPGELAVPAALAAPDATVVGVLPSAPGFAAASGAAEEVAEPAPSPPPPATHGLDGPGAGAAIAADAAEDETRESAAEELAPDVTVVGFAPLGVAAGAEARRDDDGDGDGEEIEAPPRASLARLVLAQIVIVVLAALIVLLVLKGFSR